MSKLGQIDKQDLLLLKALLELHDASEASDHAVWPHEVHAKVDLSYMTVDHRLHVLRESGFVTDVRGWRDDRGRDENFLLLNRPLAFRVLREHGINIAPDANTPIERPGALLRPSSLAGRAT